MLKGFENYKMNNFEFTSSAWKDVPFNKLRNDRIIKKLLFQNLRLKKYTDKITSVFCIYQAFEPNDIFYYREKKVMRRKTKVFEIYMNLDYYRFLEVDNEEAKSMMSELYLKGIEKFLIGRKDFKGKEFYKDVKQLFEKHKFISKKPETATNE